MPTPPAAACSRIVSPALSGQIRRIRYADVRPRIVIADLSLTPGDGLGFVRRLRAAAPGLKLLLLTVHDEFAVAKPVMAAGADGVVLKRAIASDLLPGADRLLAGERYLSPALHELSTQQRREAL